MSNNSRQPRLEYVIVEKVCLIPLFLLFIGGLIGTYESLFMNNGFTNLLQGFGSSIKWHVYIYIMIYLPFLFIEMLMHKFWYKFTETLWLHLNPIVLFLFVISLVSSLGLIPIVLLFNSN